MWPCHEKDWDVQDTFRARRACVHMCVCAHVRACVCVCVLSRVQLFTIPWTAARQAPLSMGFSRQEYWNGLPFPSPVDLSDPRIELRSAALQVDSLPSEPPGKPPRTSLNYVYFSSGEIPLNSLSRSVLYLHRHVNTAH